MDDGFSDADRLRHSILAGLGVRSGLWRTFKFVRGVWRTYILNTYRAYEPRSWWEAYHRASDGTDSDTIDIGTPDLVSRYHYASIEMIILSVLHKYGVPHRVLDLGSGAGHWIIFYESLGAEVTGLELSTEAVGRLRQKHFRVEQGDIATMALSGFDVVNAIGVMFHIVDDTEHRKAIESIAHAVKPGGLLIVGGGFPLVTVNVQFDVDGRVNKRLRSRRYWRRHLRDWQSVRFIRNREARRLAAVMPENDILVAVR